MSGNSRDYYHSSRNTGAHDRSLPPIRDVVGDELDRRARPNPYTFSDVRGALPSARAPGLHAQSGHSSRGDQRGPTLPPIQPGYTSSRSSGYPAAAESQGRVSTSQSQRSGHSADYRAGGAEDPNYTYNVLRTSGTGSSLVNARPPASHPQGILRQTAAPDQSYDQNSDRRHICEYCGKKFDRPSSLQVHLRTHTGSQPFTCEWPGCDRTFSVRSNMLRHMRSHEKAGSSHHQRQGIADRGDDEDDNEEDDPSSSAYFRTPSSSGQHSGSHYYSSSRRR